MGVLFLRRSFTAFLEQDSFLRFILWVLSWPWSHLVMSAFFASTLSLAFFLLKKPLLSSHCNLIQFNSIFLQEPDLHGGSRFVYQMHVQSAIMNINLSTYLLYFLAPSLSILSLFLPPRLSVAGWRSYHREESCAEAKARPLHPCVWQAVFRPHADHLLV